VDAILSAKLGGQKAAESALSGTAEAQTSAETAPDGGSLAAQKAEGHQAGDLRASGPCQRTIRNRTSTSAMSGCTYNARRNGRYQTS